MIRERDGRDMIGKKGKDPVKGVVRDCKGGKIVKQSFFQGWCDCASWREGSTGMRSGGASVDGLVDR